MKKVIYVILVTLLVALPCLAKQTDTDRELARTQDFIAATMKKGGEKISALNAYVKKFPETSSRWTKLAHYHLAVTHFQLQKYDEAVKFGDKTIKMGGLSEGEMGRLYLIMANSYGVKSASIFNKDTALTWAKKAISYAQSKKLSDVLKQAQSLKKQLSGPPPKKISPEQQIKMHYSDMEYTSAISYYQKLGASDKANPEIHKTYANSLFKAKRYDSALKEFKALYEKDKKAIFALRMGDIYAAKGKRAKANLDSAVNYYLEASLLYTKEGNSSNSKTAYKKAEYQLFEKHGFNKKIKDAQRQVNQQRSSAAKNEEAIRQLKRKIRLAERKLDRNYTRQDLAPPQYEVDKIDKMKKELRALESGAPAGAVDLGAKLEEEKKKIQAELKDLLARAKKRLGL